MKIGLPLLPVGSSNFREITNEGRVYVDKTKYIPELKMLDKAILLARPRRFGKSLTVLALDSFYSGKKVLFEG